MQEIEKNEDKSKTRLRLSRILNIFVFVLSILMLAVAAGRFYQTRYLTAFWVNGQSMYPTLNEHATNAQGMTLGEKGGSANIDYTVDYGVMNCHKSALKKLKRFDIVSTKYSEGDSSNKIKRIIGLPGETISFGSGENNGDLTVNGEFIEQPIAIEYVRAGNNYPSSEIVLGDDEYYVCGDNRLHSSDSRNNGPVKFEWIEGKVIALCGTAVVYLTEEHTFDVKNIDYYRPRFFK